MCLCVYLENYLTLKLNSLWTFLSIILYVRICISLPLQEFLSAPIASSSTSNLQVSNSSSTSGSGIGAGISALALSGSHSNNNQIELIVAHANQIDFVTKRGKVTRTIALNTSEPVHAIYSDDNNLWTAGAMTFLNIIDDQKQDMFICPDRIHDMCELRESVTTETYAVLGCHDNCARIVDGSAMAQQIAFDSPVTAVATSQTGSGTLLIVGKLSGVVSGVLIRSNLEYDIVFQLQSMPPKAAVTCITSCNGIFAREHNPCFAVGRADGIVEIHAIQPQCTATQVIATHNMGERVTCLKAGHVMRAESLSLLVGSFSGKLSSISIESDDKWTVQPPSCRANEIASLIAERKSLTTEVHDLQAQVAALREKHNKLDARPSIVNTNVFHMHAILNLVPEEGCYMLTVNSSSDIDSVLVCSTAPLILLHSENPCRMVSSCTTVRDAKTNRPSRVNIAYHCLEPCKQLQIKVRTLEGQSGMLTTQVFGACSPPVCQSSELAIMPLSLHRRLGVASERVDEIKTRRMNKLVVSGDFTMAHIHSWIALCMPEMPDRVVAQQADAMFESTYTGTLLHISYMQGRATFLSDSATTLAIIQDTINLHATKSHMTISSRPTVDSASAQGVVARLQPRLAELLQLGKKLEVLPALEEIVSHSAEALPLLSKSFQNMVHDAKSLHERQKKSPKQVDFLSGILTDLYVDMHKLRGVPARNVDQLVSILKTGEVSKLPHIFDPSNFV
jgi:Bardet-Biedl syndrome 7 protein